MDIISGKTSKGHPANSFPLDGRVAIVTGGSRGIGRTIALHLHSLGAKVVISYVANSNQADQLVYDLNTAANSYPVAVAVQANISEPDHVKLLFDRAEQEFDIESHILVHSAGVRDSKYPILAKTTVDNLDLTFNVNSSSAFLCCREAANRLKDGGGGRIIMISTSLVRASLTGCGEYTASKAAVEAITKIMAKGLKGIGITANCVAPGAVATELFFAGKTEEIVKRLTDACPLGRLGEPKDVAHVGFLDTDAGEWVNGGFIV